MPENTLFTLYTSEGEETLLDHRCPAWNQRFQARIERFWEGSSFFCSDQEDVPNFAEVRSLWNDQALFFRFECWFRTLAPYRPAADATPPPGLWKGDVVEIFTGPKGCDRYFEIEVSPLGQWLDVLVYRPRVDMDFHWSSGLTVQVAMLEPEKIWTVCLRLPFQPVLEACDMTQIPGVGDVWQLNLCRIAGEEPRREYLTWRPTFSPKPDFHVPSSFGNLFFLRDPL